MLKTYGRVPAVFYFGFGSVRVLKNIIFLGSVRFGFWNFGSGTRCFGYPCNPYYETSRVTVGFRFSERCSAPCSDWFSGARQLSSLRSSYRSRAWRNRSNFKVQIVVVWKFWSIWIRAVPRGKFPGESRGMTFSRFPIPRGKISGVPGENWRKIPWFLLKINIILG